MKADKGKHRVDISPKLDLLDPACRPMIQVTAKSSKTCCRTPILTKSPLILLIIDKKINTFFYPPSPQTYDSQVIAKSSKTCCRTPILTKSPLILLINDKKINILFSPSPRRPMILRSLQNLPKHAA